LNLSIAIINSVPAGITIFRRLVTVCGSQLWFILYHSEFPLRIVHFSNIRVYSEEYYYLGYNSV
jgi:hypothetical protein